MPQQRPAIRKYFGGAGVSPGVLWLQHSIYSGASSLAQRPTAKELLKHKFITRYTKKTSYLTELIDRYRRWKSEGHGEESSSDDSDMYASCSSVRPSVRPVNSSTYIDLSIHPSIH